MVPVLVLAVFTLLGVWLVFRAPDPPGMGSPTKWGHRAVVAGIVGVPFGALVGLGVLFVVSLFTGPLV